MLYVAVAPPEIASLTKSDALIAGYSLTEPEAEWDDILEDFCALGGIAENIVLGRGPSGRGLFPVDPGQPFRLYVPPNLIFPVESVSFAGDRIRISEAAAIRTPEREFFETYANALSWGGGGRQSLALLIAAFDALPEKVRTLLSPDFGMEPWLEGDPATRVERQFLSSHAFGVGGRDVLIPVFELANHESHGIEWNMDNGVEFTGSASDEILISYGLQDSFGMFHRFALASHEPVAFSLPISLQVGAIPLDIARSFEVVRRGKTMLPQLTVVGQGLQLSFVMLGHSGYPRLPRGMFRTLMKPLGVQNVDEEFDRVVHANWAKFLELLAVLEPYEGELIVSLRNMAQFQVDAMSSCIGAREI